LSDICTFFLKTLQKYDEKTFESTQVRRFFVVSRYDEVSSFIGKWKCGHKELNSGDFSAMYTNIPHDDLKRVITSVVDKVWSIGCEEMKLEDESQLYVNWVRKDSVNWMEENRQ
jgi:hypothetical protein